MTDSAPNRRSITKTALAALLGIPEVDLLSREEAAVEIKIAKGRLANLAMLDAEGKGGGPAYYRSTTSPTAGTAWYPRAEVLAFSKHRNDKIKRTYEGLTGQQDWTALQSDNARRPVHVLVRMVNDWKEAELYRRAERYVQGHEMSETEISEHERERAMILTADWPLSFCENDVCDILCQKALFIWGRENHHLLPMMLRPAWREVIITEDKWAVGDLESLPSKKPTC